MIYERRETIFRCDLDGPDCTVSFRTNSWSFTKNRAEARQKGWQLGKDRQYCPNCRPRPQREEVR